VYPIPTLRVLACTFETGDCTLSLSLAVATEHRGVSRHHEVISRSYGASEGSYRSYAREYRNSYSASLSQSHLQHSRSKIIGTCEIGRLSHRDQQRFNDRCSNSSNSFSVLRLSDIRKKIEHIGDTCIRICLGAVSAQKSKITLFRQYQVRRLYIYSVNISTTLIAVLT